MNAAAQRLPPLVADLLEPRAYPHAVKSVRLRQTHVSELFFTGDFVYKVKKPVDFGFLDFTTLQKRRFYCAREVSLNSRLSPDVYLGVSEVRLGERHTIDGPGRTVDYAVKMKQLPESDSLDQRLRSGRVSARQMRRIARAVADFHQRAETGPRITQLGDLTAVRQNVTENLGEIRALLGDALASPRLDDLEAYSQALMNVKAGAFQKRADEGRVRDGHGDLHTANVFLDGDEVQVIDCIEFNDRFRCLDVVEDVAFLAMDLDFFGRPDLAEAFLSEYANRSADGGIWEFLDFFKVYRALVRVKVNLLLRTEKEALAGEKERALELAKAYFGLAHEYIRARRWRSGPGGGRPVLLAFFGLMGSGKTALSRELARRWGLHWISSDVLRKRLAGVAPDEHRYVEFETGIYSPEFTRRTYAAMFEEANRFLARGQSAALDASFGRSADRTRAGTLAERGGADFCLVECTAPDAELQKRLNRRTEGLEATVSDGRREILERQKRRWDPIRGLPSGVVVRIGTDGPPEDTMRRLLLRLFERGVGD